MKELDEQCARALDYSALWAEDSVFGASLYLHDAGAVRDTPHSTSNAHLLGANWERLRVNGEIDQFYVRLCPAFSENHEAARILEDEIERRALGTEYVYALQDILFGPGSDYDDWGVIAFALMRATPEQKARAFLAVVEDTREG